MRFVFLILTVLAALPARAEVLFVTDVEGSRAKLEAAFRRSGDFVLGSDGFWTLKPGRRFVYGGDASDRFYGSLWVTEQLARLAEASPEDVALLLGNRDGNKPRLAGELGRDALTRPPTWLAWTAFRSGFPSSDVAERSRWLLQRTMGAPNGFELRRQELVAADRPRWVDPLRARLSAALGRAVAEDDDALVVESFRSELEPGGGLARVLDRSRITWRDGETLYLHGGLSHWNFLRVPNRPGRVDGVEPWRAALEGWYQSVLARWKRDRFAPSGDARRAAEELVQYMMPIPGARSNRRSIVTGRTGTAENMPWLPPAWVRRKLLAAGIRRIVLGHTPSGDVPAIVRSPDRLFEVVCADNSYGWREDAATLLRVSNDRIVVDGAYRDGTPAGRPLRFEARIDSFSPLGLYDESGGLVVGVEGNQAVVYRMENFEVSYRRVPIAELRGLHPAEPPVADDTIVTVVGDFDPPTLADRTRVAVLVEKLGLAGLVLGVLPDGPETGAVQAHRVEMVRRTFADMAHDVEVVALEKPPEDAKSADFRWAGAVFPKEIAAASAEAARALLGQRRTPDFLHPDALSWIGMHGLYRPLAPRPWCPAAVAAEAGSEVTDDAR